ncbi:unnamed protein product [Rotaria socialis]
MNINDESSTDYFLNPGLQTPRINKRVRSEGEHSDDCETVIIPPEKISLVINNSNQQQQASTTQRNEYPPITIECKSAHSKTDRKLIEELIKEWRIKNNKNIDIIGRFGYKNVLLVFPRSASTLDDLLETGRWPDRIAGSNYVIKYPKILPATYSLIIHDFQSTWNEDETTKELQEKCVTLRKLTRLVTREGYGDFPAYSLEYPTGSGDRNVRPEHDHFTSQCTSLQLCFRCGQHHPLKEGCSNEIKCVNCQQHHYSGHSSCPVVQQKRKQLSEQHQKPQKKHENVDQMIMAMSESINQQLSSFTSTITSQITEVSKKLNIFNDRIQNLEQQIDKSIMPAINSKEQPLAHQRPQTSSCRETIHNLLHAYRSTTFQTLRHKKQWPATNLTQILSTINNNTQ